MSLPPHGIFSLRNKAAHSQRRSLLSHAFSQQNINDCMPIIEQKLDSLLQSFDCDTIQTVDVFLRFRLFAFDVVGELFLGTSFGASEAGTAPEYLHDVDRQFLFSGIKFNFPLLATFLSQIPLASMKTFTRGGERLAQRDPIAFPDPDVFLPDRWLYAEPTTSMKALFMPFSKGTRACIGKSLAKVELRLVVLGLLSRYEVKLAPQTTEESMEIRDHFLVMPKSGKCELVFEPLPEGALAKA
ncbi:hypothetical protein B0A54_07803 [Friedmanniomyces endolithicus]|uniref:Cytochrome P450 n=1 Tax=Friedmanniomyces endolithicus TaxID=329885 RepID=A0A4U0UXH5_9PEZI|nr:hypothetical protein B0A54_07803 [Friedmanniomyces endolithicus]